jgi:crossover junction endodeoxyribonuclease RuvC
MRILAFDPGPTKTGFGVVDCEGLRFRYVAAGHVPSDVATLRALLLAHPLAAVAIEVIGGYVYEHKRGAMLLATKPVEERIARLMGDDRPAPLTLTASVVRRAAIGRGSADDAAVAAVVRARLVGLPARTNVHARDALLLAMVAAPRFLARRDPPCAARYVIAR